MESAIIRYNAVVFWHLGKLLSDPCASSSIILFPRQREPKNTSGKTNYETIQEDRRRCEQALEDLQKAEAAYKDLVGRLNQGDWS